MKMNTELIKALIGEFKGSNLTKLRVKYEDFELELEREKEVVCTVPNEAQTVPTSLPILPIQQIVQTEVNVEASPKEVQGHAIKAPMVGTFYASTSPTSKPFVEIGTKLKKGDVICILEAMKLMNEVEADCEGEVVEILVKDEDMVEFGQTMFVIK